MLGRPASLSAQPSHAARFPLPSLPHADARLAPPGGGHMAAVRRRRGCATADRLIPVGMASRAPRRHSVSPAPLSSSSPVRERSSRNSSAATPSLAELHRSPPEALVTHSLRQDHHRNRLRRGKPLRTLYRGERPPQALNRSPEFPRPRRRAPPCRNLLVLASFRLLLSALDP